jgi:hypothetical protein
MPTLSPSWIRAAASSADMSLARNAAFWMREVARVDMDQVDFAGKSAMLNVIEGLP